MMNKMILANVAHRPVRTLISVLAVAIEVAMVMVVVGLTTGLLQESAKRIEGVGADLMVQPPGSSYFIGLTNVPMPIKIGDRLAELQHVQAVAPVLLYTQTAGGLNIIYGIDPVSFDRVTGGFAFHSGGVFAGPYDVMVDDIYALANHVKVGQNLTLLNHSFHVSGVVEHGKGARIFVPLETLQDLMEAHGEVSIFFVKCTDPGYVDDVVNSAKQLLHDYKVLSVQEFESLMTSNNLPALESFIRAMIGIAVAIGFLVIFLSMYTTIHERTREIGILKSLGASKRYIIAAILREAALLCVVGIAGGWMGAVFARKLILEEFPTLSVALSTGWALRAAALALAGGLIGALYPAVGAARLDPVDALAYE